MLKKAIVSGFIASAIWATAGFSQTAPASPAATPAAQGAAKSLKAAYAGKFLIGTACDPGNYSDAEQANIKANYNVITPENCMKPGPMQPTEGNFAWDRPDTLVKWCQDNQIEIWGHNLCWHAQAAQWMFTAPDGGAVSKDLLLQRLKTHILTVVGHYKGKLRGWDVVNEAINDGGNGLNGAENLRPSNWSRIIGPEFLTDCFKWAHEADPKAGLYYNDYNIEQGAVRNTGKHAASMALLKRLIKDECGITGVGIQGHWSLSTNLADVEKSIEDYESLGLKVSISELDITVSGTNSGAMPTGGAGGAPVANDVFQRQAQMYAKLFDIFNRHAKTMERVTLWGINDRRSWRSGQSPLLFDGQMEPKPAFQAILDVALGKGATTLPQ